MKCYLMSFARNFTLQFIIKNWEGFNSRKFQIKIKHLTETMAVCNNIVVNLYPRCRNLQYSQNLALK